MSTRTIISAKILGHCFSIYCHHDGYPEHIIPLEYYWDGERWFYYEGNNPRKPISEWRELAST